MDGRQLSVSVGQAVVTSCWRPSPARPARRRPAPAAQASIVSSCWPTDCATGHTSSRQWCSKQGQRAPGRAFGGGSGHSVYARREPCAHHEGGGRGEHFGGPIRNDADADGCDGEGAAAVGAQRQLEDGGNDEAYRRGVEAGEGAAVHLPLPAGEGCGGGVVASGWGG